MLARARCDTLVVSRTLSRRPAPGPRYRKDVSDSRLFESITYGVVGTGMPPWDVLSEDQRWDLVNYVRFLSTTGPAASGRGK